MSLQTSVDHDETISAVAENQEWVRVSLQQISKTLQNNHPIQSRLDTYKNSPILICVDNKKRFSLVVEKQKISDTFRVTIVLPPVSEGIGKTTRNKIIAVTHILQSRLNDSFVLDDDGNFVSKTGIDVQSLVEDVEGVINMLNRELH